MARKVLKKQMVMALEEMEEATTQEITCWVQERYRWGCTINQAANILVRYPEFVKVTFIDRVVAQPGHYSQRIRGCVWRLADEC